MLNPRAILGTLALAAYILTIPAANWAIAHYGTAPVGFGLTAPAAVYTVGIALVLRDLTREALGRGATIAAIATGTVLSLMLSTPALALASAAAFAASETLDMAVYEPLRKRDMMTALVASNAVGLTVDSLIFLSLAFGNLTYLPGQMLGKAWMTVAAIPVITLAQALIHRHRYRTAAA